MSKPITLLPDQETALDVEIDLAKLYEKSGGEILDLSNSDNWGTHDSSKAEAINFLTSNYANAFSIK